MAHKTDNSQVDTAKLDGQVLKAEAAAARGDSNLAVKLLTRAAGAGHAYASALLGAWQVLGYQQNVDRAAGLLRLHEAAASGESSTSAFLAYLYASGLHVDQDW